MNYFNQYQYDDLLVKQADPYANAKYKIILKCVHQDRPLRILNAGCGSGELSFLLASLGHTVIGIDPTPEYIDLARKFAKKKNIENCSFQVSTIEEFTGEGGFDVVIATDVLEHIEDDSFAANKLISLLSTGGLLVITVPALQALFGFHDEQIGHFRRYSKATLTRLLEKGGSVTTKYVRYFGWTLIPVCVLWSKLLRRPYPIAETGGSKKTIVGRILNALLFLDTHSVLPFGTSLILFGRKIV